MKVIGAHAILHMKDAETDRSFLRDVFQFRKTIVDLGRTARG
jgi:hypothetical protein